jgi:hypothetical protein
MIEYRVIELVTVTDDEIERALNAQVALGWTFESIHFAMRESSKRPAMAFLTFVRKIEPEPPTSS